jgi:DNA-binding NarL/FixJ family response regulator
MPQTLDNPSAAERSTPITVVLVDDEQLIRVALAQALSSSGLELVGEAATGEDAIELVVDVRPDVVMMDLQPFAKPEHRRQPRRQDPRQASRREPHPGSR